MKIEVSQYQPSILRRLTTPSAIVGKIYEGYTGISLGGEKILGVSIHRGIVLSDHPFDYSFKYLAIWFYILTWPILIDIRWNKRLSTISKANG